ncbi:phosphate/phosphite/phosphonate ABC transporter substrate-binding protein [Janthinobacterium aquaticum]|uniref:phosphate/phosphite/phosphonate ABC transporter substrate-binding protein n=1 Tax=Janthinobacterium sp. FT58W TaxID=2654254 RepID=UPI00186AF4D6|nr:PhnD/SsuA/transferrin family substrate-binding protein [Janthinobacterium sp. FT58W]
MMWRHWCASLFLSLSIIGTGAEGANRKDVTIGVFAYQGERTATSDWRDLATYLDREIPEHRFLLKNYDAAGLRRAVATGEVDLVITNPGYYIALETEVGVSRIATLSSPTVPAIASVILTRADRADLRELSDLKGKRIAAVSPDAFAGYLVAAREMLDAGVDPETDLGERRFIGLPMFRAIEAIMEGEVDAGIVKACMAEQMVRKGLITINAEVIAIDAVSNDQYHS